MRKLFIYLTIILLFINNAIFSNINIDYAPPQLIKVACVKDTGYIERYKEDSYKGYLVDYLQTLGEYYNLKFDYIFAENNEECLKLVKNGDADISSLQYKNPKYENDYSYSNYPIKNLNTTLYTLAENNDYYYDDFIQIENMIIGIRKDLETLSQVLLYAENNNINLKLKYYESDKALKEAIINHEIDSMITDYSFFPDIKLKKLSEIHQEPVYLITNKDNPLIEIINKSTIQLSENNSNMMNILFNKHQDNINAITAFTRNEQEYINNSDKIKVGLLANSHIQSRYNSKTQKYEGLIIDYMEELSKLSHIDFEYLEIPNNLNAQEALSQGFCDITPYFVRNKSSLNDPNIVVTINYINMRQLIVINKNNPISLNEINSISCPNNYQGLIDLINEEYPKWDIVKENANSILDPLLERKVDVAIGNEYEIKYLLQNPKYDKLLSNETYLFDILLSIGINKSQDQRLLSVLNKSIKNINNITIEDIKLKGGLTNYHYTFYDSYYANSDLFNLIIFLILAIIISLIVFSRYQKNLNYEISLKEAELNETNKNYEKANKAKSEFLAAMSHDLRTPMNAIIGLTELSKENIDNKELLDQYINKIDISSKYLLSLINDILDISAIEDGKLNITKTPLNLKNLIQEISSMYNLYSEQNDLYFKVTLNRIYHEFLIGDYFRIKQIITNLLSNAFKFTPKKGNVWLTINEISSNDNKLLLNIIVKDTGIGIKKDLQNKIFKKFVQADNDTFNKYGGSGLGLSIVSNLVSLMNGSISIESIEGKGSTFSVTIPLEIDLEKENYEISLKDTSNIRILFVDSDIESIFDTHKILSQKSIYNDYAISINEGYGKILINEEKNIPYNILIIDSELIKNNPNFINSKLASYFKRKDKHLIISGYDITYLKKTIIDNEIEHYLRKPILLSSIIYIINNIDNLHSTNNKDYSEITHELTGLRVLLCEDNKINQIVGKHLIENFGATVTIADDGKICLEKYLNSNGDDYDIILMDIRMPNMNGYEATKMIRNSNLKNSKDIPIYALTANVTKKDIEDSLKYGMNGHISKPIDSKKLYSILKNIWLRKNIELY